MSQTCAELSHLVDIVYALALKEVEAVEVLIVVWEEKLTVRLLDRDDRLEDRTLALLDPLTHRVEVCREVAGCREDTLAVLTLALSVELLPPLSHEVKLRLEVSENLNLLAGLSIESLTGSSILC